MKTYKDLYKTALFMLLWTTFQFSNNSFAQPSGQFSNISLPDNQRDFITLDICTSKGDSYLPQNLLFIYNTRKILVVDAENTTDIIGEITVSNYGKNSERYTELHRVPAISYMVYNIIDHELYYMVPDMKINAVQLTVNNGQIQISTPETIVDPEENYRIKDCNGVQGYSIIRYNHNTDRLYWVVNGTNSLTYSGSQPVNCFFGIYTRANGTDFSELTDPQIFTQNIDIYDITYNDYNNSLNDDFFYVSKDNVWEIYKIDANGNVTLETTQDISGGNNPVKNGWFLKTATGSNYKIFCLPHDNHFDSNPSAQHALLVIDGNISSPVFVNTGITLPQSRVYYSGVHLPSSDELILGILPSEGESLLYRFSVNDPNLENPISLDGNISNYCKHICLDQFGNLIIGRKDCITTYINGTYQNILQGFNNYYFKSLETSTLNQSYISCMNPISSGIETLISTQTVVSIDNNSPLITGQALFSGVFNPANENTYFFSRTYYENGKVYYVDANLGVSTIDDFTDAVGDCIYNPYTEELLISAYASAGEIRKYNSSNVYNSNNPINLSYPEKLFITPDNRLIVSSNMLYIGSSILNIDFYEADTYNSIASHTINHGWALENGSRIKAAFAYNNGNKSIAALFSPVENTATDLIEYSSQYGILYIIPDDNSTGTVLTLSFNPREAIYCGHDNKLIISSSSGLHLYDEASQQWDQRLSNVDIFGLSYDQIREKLYVIGNDQGESKLWEVNCTNFEVSGVKHNFGTSNLEASSIHYNQQSNLLLAMAYPTGHNNDRDIKLFEFNIENNYSYELNNTGNLLTIGRDVYFHYQQNKFIQDPINLRVFYPHGLFSNISKVQYDSESLKLNPDGITWISFPRLDRDPSTGNMSAISSVTGRINPELGFGDEGFLIGQGPLNVGTQSIEWNQQTQLWGNPSTGALLQDVHSTEGYILKLTYETSPPPYTLELQGSLLAPDASIDQLYADKENWIGYWIIDSQDPLDAFAHVLDELDYIKGQDWFCACQPNPNKSTAYDPGVPYDWTCLRPARLDYGDMVMVKPKDDIFNFQYNWINKNVDHDTREDAEYYSYTEKASYEGLVIELDSGQNPVEIAAFVGDSCIGAQVVYPDDSLCHLQAYTEGLNGEITIDEYFGSDKSTRPRIRQYMVLNKNTLRREKRSIHTSEKQGIYFISLKEQGENKNVVSEAVLNCWPNPTTGVCHISLYNPLDTELKLEVCDMFGRPVGVIEQGNKPKGNYTIEWDAAQLGLSPGMYFIKLSSAYYSITRKIFYAE